MSLFTDEQPQIPEQARVSILERVVPSLSFGLASLSGIVGSIMTIRVFIVLREAESAGMDSIAEALSLINYAMLGLLGLSLAIGFGGTIFIIVRMFSDRPKSSPPGFLYLIAGIPNLISPILVAFAWSVVVDVVLGRNADDPTATGAWISQILIIAVVAGVVSLIILPIFSFVPFSARRGKKISSVVALAIVVIGIAAIVITLIGLADVLMSDPSVTYDPSR